MTEFYPALTCYIPKNLEFTKIKGYNHRWHEKYVWFLHSIVFESLTNKHSFGGYVNLSKSMLQKYLGTRYTEQIIQQLKQSGVIQENSKYSAGAYSKSYRLTKRYNKGIKGTRIDKQTYCRKVEKFRQNYLSDIFKENERAKHEFLQLTYARIDIQSAMDYIYTHYQEDTPQFKARVIAVDQFHAMHKATFADGRYTNIDFTFKVNKGRIYSPVTMLPRDLEQFVYFEGYEGEPVTSADAPNSQLCFFNELIKRRGKKMHNIGENIYDEYIDGIKDIDSANNIEKTSVPTPLNPSSLSTPYVITISDSWEDYIFNGKGYERMMGLCAWRGKFSNHTKQERQEFKEEFFGNLFYNRWRPELTDMERVFMTYHEKEAKALRAIKKKLGNKLLAVEVQRLEALFFHSWIVDYMKANYKNVPFAIKHDSIMLPASEGSYIIEELNQLFKQFFDRKEIELKVSVL